jgi:hypothetical protein
MNQFTSRNIPFGGLRKTDEQTLHAITELILDTISVRLSLERSNPKMMQHEGFWARNSEESWLFLIVPFIVMDELLYFNPDFERELNMKFFFQLVPEQIYNTVKMKCLSVQKQKVKLTLFHTYYFVLCLNCALQLMNSNFESRFLPALEKRKVDRQASRLFIKEGAVMLSTLKRFLVRSNVELKMENLTFDFKSFMG